MLYPTDSKFKYYLYNNLSRTFSEIRNGTICGRVLGDLLYPKDDLISRQHCRFIIEGNEIYVEDFQSTNKTFVNTVPIQPQKRRRIRLHDVIEIGTQRFVLTNQRFHAPCNVQDSPRLRQVYKARMNDRGTLTSHFGNEETQKTLIVVDRAQFHRLRFRSTLKPVKKNYSTALIIALCVVVALAAAFLLAWFGAFHPNSPHAPQWMILKFFTISLSTTLLATLLYRLVCKVQALGPLTKTLTAAVILGVSFFGAWKTADAFGLLADLNDNLAASACIDTPAMAGCKAVRIPSSHY